MECAFVILSPMNITPRTARTPSGTCPFVAVFDPLSAPHKKGGRGPRFSNKSLRILRLGAHRQAIGEQMHLGRISGEIDGRAAQPLMNAG